MTRPPRTWTARALRAAAPALLLGATAAAADPTAEARLLDAARAADRAQDPAAERAACAALVALAPTGRGGPACAARLRWLDEHSDLDGGFDDLHLLRAAGAGRAPIEALRPLLHPEAARPATTAAAALALAAAAPPDAAARVLADRWAVEQARPTLARAERLILGEQAAAALIRAGSPAAAAQIEAELAPPRAQRPLEGAPRARAAAATARLLQAAGLLLTLGALGLLGPARRGWALGPRPYGPALLLGITALCAALAAAWEPMAGARVLGLGLLLLPLQLLCAGALAAPPVAPLRRACAAAATAGALPLAARLVGLDLPGFVTLTEALAARGLR
ncbi:MAG: hypothetical protein JNM72_07600 [Deltaproteobacteria bacterium]|nr:hypothetical protein [Deltaproteobacteria bacterium]